MNRNLLLVTISLFAWGMGEGLFIYFQPLYLQEFGPDPVMIGSIFGVMGVAMAVFQIPSGYLSDRFGSRSIMWASWFLGTSAAWTMALANTLPTFVVGLILYGLTSFVVAPMNSYITKVRGDWSVGRALTFPSGFYHLGAVLGPISGGLIADRLGLKTVYMVAAIIFIISTIIVLFTSQAPETHHADQVDAATKGTLKNPRFFAFLVITLLSIFAIYLPQPFTPSFLQNQQAFSRSMIGILGAVGSLGNAVATLALGSLPSVIGFIIGQAWVLVFSLTFLFARVPFWFGFGYFFIGGYRLCRSMVLAISRTLVNPRQTGLAYGMVETMNAIAVIIAPVIAGVLYKNNPLSIFSVSLVIISITIILNLTVLVRQKRGRLHEPEN